MAALGRGRWIAIGVVLAAAVVSAQAPATLEVGAFSRAQPGVPWPEGWKPLTFPKIPRHTEYALVSEHDEVVVRAESRASASGMIREMRIDPRVFPIVRWRWKVTGTVAGSDLRRKDGDDYAARLYITFAYDPTKVGLFEKAKYEAARLLYGDYPPVAALNYVWGTHDPPGTMTPNPYTDRAMMIVVRNGDAGVNRWMREERNLADDYRVAFGGEAPMVSGVAIMTDTDNTREHAVAYYGDILFSQQ